MALVRHGSVEDITREIEGFLTHFDEVDPFRHPRRLQFHFGHGNILIATIVAKKKLHLDFSTGKQEFPRPFGWHLEMNSQILINQPSPSTFFVKTLHLTSVSYLTSDKASSMVSNSSFLESSNITKCDGLRSLSIDAHQKFRYLTVLDCFQMKSLHIRAFKLQSFRYRGLLPWFWLKHVLSLEDSMLDFREGPGYSSFKFDDFNSLLLAIRNVQILTLCKWTFEALISPWLSSVGVHFRFNKLKELQWIDSSIEENKIDALLSFLKFCPLLERLFINKFCKIFYSDLHNKAVTLLMEICRLNLHTSYCLPNTGNCLNQVTTHTRLGRLKVVVLEGHTNQEDEILLAEHLLQVVSTEPLIIARSNGNCVRSLVKIPSHQAKQQSMGKVVAPLGRKCSYKFVEEVKDTSQLCSKHA